MLQGRAIHDALSGVALLCFIGALAFVISHCTGCSGPQDPTTTPAMTPPCRDAGLSQAECAASYQAALVLCSQSATSFEESIACENDVRAHYGRPPRVVRLRDGGVR